MADDSLPDIEEWRPVPDYEGWYEVSSYGRVRRIRHWRGVRRDCLKQFPAGHGKRLTVSLSKEGKVRRLMVHRLVCMAFHGAPPTPEHEAAHNDGNHLNNRFPNLRWATHAENIEDAILHRSMRRGEKHWNKKLSEDDVISIRRQASDGRPYRTIGLHFGVSCAAVSDIVNRRHWAHVE